MKTKEKSLELAKLMGWDIAIHGGDRETPMVKISSHKWWALEPYANRDGGLAQFAAIALKFPFVFGLTKEGDHDMLPTQERILDEILRRESVLP